LGLTDYPKIIKTPMDMTTIKVKLNNEKYSNRKEVKKDIKQIWDNCKLYNREGSVNIYSHRTFIILQINVRNKSKNTSKNI
jgi:hypothetical protein